MAWGTGGTRKVSAEFRRNRPIVLARDAFQCQLRWQGCTATAVEVDHRRNFARGGTDDLDNLQSVCAACHKRKTGREAAAARAELRRAARHPDSLRKHPGYV
ncbi:HNH endonuclease [Nocardia sp. MW-W600-9]